ncbi:MAG: nucleotidyltransferase domain-containing protein [Prolixibacteraceae bacterium]|nr:nucleotidyltransferase domain-containing protein [Prolixibacteraceae bacterium]
MSDKLTILRDLKSYLQSNYSNSVKDIILFGSQAHGNSNENSDYDVLIVLKNDYTARDENQIYDLCYDMNLKYSIIIDAHLISEKELTTIKGRQPIFSKAIKSGIYA